MHVNIHLIMPISSNIYLYKLFLSIPSSYLKCTIHCCCVLSVQGNGSLELCDLCFSSCDKYIILTDKNYSDPPQVTLLRFWQPAFYTQIPLFHMYVTAVPVSVHASPPCCQNGQDFIPLYICTTLLSSTRLLIHVQIFLFLSY